MLNLLRQYMWYQEIKLKELIEYKTALFLWILSNISYFVVAFFAVVFVSTTTNAFPLEVGALLLITSYLIWDIAHLFIISEGMFDNDLYIYGLTKPYKEIIFTLESAPKKLIIILVEFLILLFLLVWKEIKINLYFVALFFIGVAVFILLKNLLYLVSVSINKSDTCPICYLIDEVQGMLSKYPYTLFTSSRIFLVLLSITMANFYTYEPVKALLFTPDIKIIAIGGIVVLILYTTTKAYYSRVFLKIFETYGG